MVIVLWKTELARDKRVPCVLRSCSAINKADPAVAVVAWLHTKTAQIFMSATCSLPVGLPLQTRTKMIKTVG